MLMTPMTRIAFQANFSQVLYCTRASARPPMMAPLVGVNRFTRPLPPQQICTITSGLKPSCWASGPMMGIEAEAMPEEDGMRKLSTM